MTSLETRQNEPVTAASQSAILWQRRLQHEAQYGLLQGTERQFHSLRQRLQAQGVTIFLKAFGLYARGARNACVPCLREEVFVYADLPGDLDGLRILHISDTHFMRSDNRFLDPALRLVDELEVDLCALTGDYRYGYYGPEDEVPPKFARLLDHIHVRLGTFAVLGNHDVSTVVPGLRALGIQVLMNEGVALRIGDTPLWVGGVDDPHRFRCASVESAMAQAPKDAFRLLLAHSPEVHREAAAHGCRLCLCGHTHGGQVRLPGLGAVISNARSPRKYVLGRWRYENLQGYTTAGLGSTDVPVRFSCPPEIVCITLRRGATSA